MKRFTMLLLVLVIICSIGCATMQEKGAKTSMKWCTESREALEKADKAVTYLEAAQIAGEVSQDVVDKVKSERDAARKISDGICSMAAELQ